MATRQLQGAGFDLPTKETAARPKLHNMLKNNAVSQILHV
jgi:hypothetical protein